LAYKEGQEISLITRNDVNRTSDFLKIAAAIYGFKASTLLLDGEVVVFRSERSLPASLISVPPRLG
jgi:ATP-dependent DNA ligase